MPIFQMPMAPLDLDENQRLVNASPLAIVSLGPNEIVQIWNSAATQTFGWNEQEAVKTKFPPAIRDDQNRFQQLCEQVFQGHSITRLDMKLHKKNRTPIDVSISAGPLRDSQQQITGVMAIIADVTHQKEEITRIYQEAQKAIRMRDEFLSIASHELKTPLTAHRLLLQTMRLTLKKLKEVSPLVDRIDLLLEKSDIEITRLSKMIDNLFDVTRISSGNLVLEKQNMDLLELAHEVIARFRSAEGISSENIQLTTNGPVIGYWDRSRLEQVLTNLLSNAVKYGCNRPILVSVTARDQQAELIVQDLGLGIPDLLQTNIFERFKRATAEKKDQSLGLGLYIVRQILNAHAGSISVQSESGKGSRFIVHIPLHS